MSCEKNLDKYFRYTKNYLFKIEKGGDFISNRHNLEDVAQEVLIAFSKSNHTVGVTKVYGFLKTVAYRKLIEAKKAHAKHHAKHQKLPKDAYDEDGHGHEGTVRAKVREYIESGSLDIDDHAIIRDCLLRLSDSEFQLFYNYYYKNATTRTLSGSYDVSHGTVANRIKAIRRKVLDCIRGD